MVQLLCKIVLTALLVPTLAFAGDGATEGGDPTKPTDTGDCQDIIDDIWDDAGLGLRDRIDMYYNQGITGDILPGAFCEQIHCEATGGTDCRTEAVAPCTTCGDPEVVLTPVAPHREIVVQTVRDNEEPEISRGNFFDNDWVKFGAGFLVGWGITKLFDNDDGDSGGRDGRGIRGGWGPPGGGGWGGPPGILPPFGGPMWPPSVLPMISPWPDPFSLPFSGQPGGGQFGGMMGGGQFGGMMGDSLMNGGQMFRDTGAGYFNGASQWWQQQYPTGQGSCPYCGTRPNPPAVLPYIHYPQSAAY